MISPTEFIPLAEENGEITYIGQWMLNESCRFMRRLQDTYPASSPLVVSVNLSASEFLRPGLVWRIAHALRESGLDPACLRLEITESVLMKDTPGAIELLRELKTLGVQLAVDDFGTGYSSLNYLRRLPADVLKIDQSFVADLGVDERVTPIIEAVLDLSRALGMAVVAEGIETADQLLRLRAAGCTRGQGYHFSRPVEQPALVQMVDRGNPLLKTA